MTSVTSGVHVVRQYRWESPSPGVYGDIRDALLFAQKTAEGLGINVKCDDWLHYECWDESVRFWFDVEDKEDKRPPTLRRIFVDSSEIETAASDVRDKFDKMEGALSFHDVKMVVRAVIDSINSGRP